MSESPASPSSRPARSPGARKPEPSLAGLSFLVWAVAVVSLITAIFALVAYNDLNSSFLRSGPETELQKALLRGAVGWSVLFTAAYASLGVRLYQVNDNDRPGEPRAIYWTIVAVAGFHIVVSGWALNGAWGNWMDVVSFLLPAAVLGSLASISTRAALLGS